MTRQLDNAGHSVEPLNKVQALSRCPAIPSNGERHMANEKPTAAPRVVFDPVKLEQLNVSKDYPMEREDFQRLFKYNAYCEMAHINKHGYPIVTPMFYVIHDGFLQMSSIRK
jgi:hypothetical protein